MTHDYDGELVVFLIGMRINKPWRPDLWLPVFGAMPAMLAELSKDTYSGLLGYRLTFGAGGPLLVQYWNSHEKLYHYASETYLVERAESVYAGMPVSGLAAATSSVPVARRGETAAERLDARQTGSLVALSSAQRFR